MPAADPSVVVLDSNIWLYAFIIDPVDDRKRKAAKALFAQYHAVLITPQIVNEVCLNMKRRGGASEPQIIWIARMMLNNHKLIPFSLEIALRASELRQRYSISFWDSMIVASAIETHYSAVVSEDMQHGLQIESLRIENPFQAKA